MVLNHVMSIFTYMGANIMRQDDTYSFQIIANTLDTVVPEIIKVLLVCLDYRLLVLLLN